MNALGVHNNYGFGIPINYKKAVRWYKLAAEEGYLHAISNLGSMYLKGKGVPRDYKEALRLFRLAAEKEDVQALNLLGLMYYEGHGVIKNYKHTFNYHFATTKETEHLVSKYLANISNIEYFINTDENLKEKYFKKSLITVAKSGTISLDLCKNQVPYITIYRLSWLNYFIIKPFIKAKYINIINIMADKEIIPELIQSDCNSKMIISKLDYFFGNKNKLKALVENYNLVLNELSNKNSSKQIADDLIKNLN